MFYLFKIEILTSFPQLLRKQAFSSQKIGYSPSPVSSSQHSLSLKNVPFLGKSENVEETKGRVFKRWLSRTAFALVALTFFQNPAFAKAAKATEAAEHLHTGQKIANFFMGFGLPRWAVLATISAMPVVELRGAVPVGVWLGMPITQVLPICVLGNMAPIVPMMFLLRNERLK
jgi:hypothetical protein